MIPVHGGESSRLPLLLPLLLQKRQQTSNPVSKTSGAGLRN